MTGESSEQPRKRGRPNHSLIDNKKKNKRITDQKARQENRDIVVGLTEAAPTLKQLLEAFSSITDGDWVQKVTYIQDAIGRWNERVQLQQDEGGNIMPCILEIKDAISEAVSPLRIDLQNVMRTMALVYQYNHNLVQSSAEQPNNQYECPQINSWDLDLLERNPPGPQFWEGLNIDNMYSTSTCDENGENFDDEQVKTYFQECDGNTKRQVNYSDFNGLQEELNKVEHNCFPPFLAPIIQKINDAYGDITKKSKLSYCAIHPTLVMFYTTIKEMDEIKKVKDVHISKLRVWRDAICDALQINMEVEFAKQHLIKIAHAYFASKMVDPKIYDRKKTLEVELEQICTVLELYEKSQSEAIFFNEKPLNTGLFP